MTITLELEIEESFEWNPSYSKQDKITVLNRRIAGKLEDLVMEAVLDHREYIPEVNGKRWIDLIGNITVIDIK